MKLLIKTGIRPAKCFWGVIWEEEEGWQRMEGGGDGEVEARGEERGEERGEDGGENGGERGREKVLGWRPLYGASMGKFTNLKTLVKKKNCCWNCFGTESPGLH